jgi:geranylgeranyl reductase family protein
MFNYDAIIVGGGPAGSSAAISLAQGGAGVLLVEEKRMPREKLCGEFITPECFPSLERLRVMNQMIAAGAQEISRVSLVVSSGKSVDTQFAGTPSDSTSAMSLSRARFDQILFDRAREAGAECLEGVAVKKCVSENGSPRAIEAIMLQTGKSATFNAPLVIDASGRNSRLTIGRRERVAGRRGSRLYALKAHLKNVESIDNAVELFFFPQGYGGLARVEDDLVNLCFIVDEQTLKVAGGDPSKVLEASVMNNSVARERLRAAEVVGKWHSAGPLTFGKKRLASGGIIAIGDASGMIDPFTGTGIQIALRTGEIAAQAILEANHKRSSSTINSTKRGHSSSSLDSILTSYERHYESEFSNRMKIAGLLRIAAFSPVAAGMLAGVLARSPRLASFVIRATRSGNGSGDFE